MTGAAPCSACGQPVIHLTLYNGQRRLFDAQPHDGATTTRAERWFLSASRGAVPQDLALDVPPGADYLTLHRCINARVGYAEPDIAADRAIARSKGTRVVDLPLVDPHHEYTYRWPSSWAHIARTPFQTICGSRMPEGRRTKPRERERLRSMPVCPTCIERYRRFVELRRAGAAAGEPCEVCRRQDCGAGAPLPL